MMFEETEGSLLEKLENYKRTRQTAAPSMLAWCDSLIRETQTKLEAMQSRNVAAVASQLMLNGGEKSGMPFERNGGEDFRSSQDGCSQVNEPAAASVYPR